MESFDFKGLAAALVASARELLPSWFPAGRWRGREFVIGSIQGEVGESLSVNSTTGVWSDFSGPEGNGGADLISLYAAKERLSQLEAAQKLSGYANGINGHARGSSVPEASAVSAPIDAPDPPPHYIYGIANGLWRYFLASSGGGPVLIQARYDLPDGKKTFSQWTWRGGKWQGKSLPAPRPLYRLRELLAAPTMPVLVVEGEKAADAAASALTSHAVITWSGGAQAAKQTDWAPLASRQIILWPDADKPGREVMSGIAADLIKRGCTVSVVNVDARPEAWDAADAVADMEDLAAIVASATLIKPLNESNVVDLAAKRIAKQSGSTHVSIASAFVSWESLGLDCNAGNVPHPTLANASLILQRHPDVAGTIWYDTFRGKVFRVVDGKDVQWTDNDDLDLTVWIQQSMKLPKLGLGTVRDAVVHAARRIAKNSLHEYLNGLEWDGISRLADWLHDCLGVDRNPYTQAIARNWPIAMIARAFRPGCQVDNMPVLEGKMGKGKSSFLEMLGAPWFASLPDEFGSKDFLQEIQGCWLIEVPDMTGFTKKEHTHVLAIITRRNDRYRAPWARHVQDHPRISMFGATSETDDYLQDSRGRRRYWPLRCISIDLDALAACRDQVFAEAFAQYKQGALWHEMPNEETAVEQEERITQDPWQKVVTEYCHFVKEVTAEEILSSENGIGMMKERQTRREIVRVTAILRELGWRRAWPKDENGKTRAVWIPSTK